MGRFGTRLTVLFYGSFALVIAAAAYGVLARDLPLAARLAPMALAYALMLLLYRLWVRAARGADGERRPDFWTRIALRLLHGPEIEPAPADEAAPTPRAA